MYSPEEIVEAYKKRLDEKGFIDIYEFLAPYPIQVYTQDILRALRKAAMIYRLQNNS